MLLKMVLYIALIYIGVRFIKSLTGPKRPSEAPRPAPPVGSEPPHEVLGVEPNASSEEIRAAYQRLVQQYHPDRVADMGPEVREVAEKRTKEINAAYAALKRN